MKQEQIQCGKGTVSYCTSNGSWGNVKIGTPVTVRGIECHIVRIRPAGTIDVTSLDGKYSYRVSGLNFR